MDLPRLQPPLWSGEPRWGSYCYFSVFYWLKTVHCKSSTAGYTAAPGPSLVHCLLIVPKSCIECLLCHAGLHKETIMFTQGRTNYRHISQSRTSSLST
jgi:hypothetical protein